MLHRKHVSVARNAKRGNPHQDILGGPYASSASICVVMAKGEARPEQVCTTQQDQERAWNTANTGN